jgi:tRNA A58 N-methylase Trm61
MICFFNTPINFLFDYFKSIYSKNNKSLRLLPWMNYKVINYLVTHELIKGKKVFEYGSGTSTHFWLKMGAKELVSVEHDEDFYKLNLESLSQICNYVLAKPEIYSESNKSNFFNSDVDKGYSYQNYVNYINNYEDNYFDIIVIDGRARNACLAICISKLSPDGIIIFDNSNRERYASSLKNLRYWPSKYFIGSVRGLLSLEQTHIIFKK